jgi:hypothetical protein
LLRYFVNDFEMVPVAPVITGITYVFTLRIYCISIERLLDFKIISASFLTTFLSREIAVSVNIRVSFPLSRIMMSVLLLDLVFSVLFVSIT